jgi:hypothetical protein
MYCDRSALLKKAIKATARRLKNKLLLTVTFWAFGRLVFVSFIFQIGR